VLLGAVRPLDEGNKYGPLKAISFSRKIEMTSVRDLQIT
jgi:hypothetical protein